MAEIVGLDFGTTNSLIALVQGGEAISLTDRATKEIVDMAKKILPTTKPLKVLLNNYSIRGV